MNIGSGIKKLRYATDGDVLDVFTSPVLSTLSTSSSNLHGDIALHTIHTPCTYGRGNPSRDQSGINGGAKSLIRFICTTHI